MSTLTLEQEQSRLIEEIRSLTDINLLRRVQAYLHRETETEETGEYMTKAEILAEFDEACKEMKAALNGEIQGMTEDEFFYALRH